MTRPILRPSPSASGLAALGRPMFFRTFSRTSFRTSLRVLVAAALTAGLAACATDPVAEIALGPPAPPLLDLGVHVTDRIAPSEALVGDAGVPDVRSVPVGPDLTLPDLAFLPDLPVQTPDLPVLADVLPPDMGVLTPPVADGIAIMPQTRTTYIAWVSGGRLFTRCLREYQGCSAAPVVVARVGTPPLPIRGMATNAGVPWVVVVDQVTGEAIAYDVKNLPAGGNAEGRRLALYGPVVMGITGTGQPEVVVVGQKAPDNPLLVWRRLTNDSVLPLIEDRQHLPRPVSIIGHSEGAYFAFSSGQCLSLTVEPNVDPEQEVANFLKPAASWACLMEPGSILGGKNDDIFAVVRDPTTQTLSLRRATPGHVDRGNTPATRVAMPGTAVSWDANYPRFSDGGTIRTVGPAGNTVFWLVRERVAAAFDLPNPDLVLGIAPLVDEYRMLRWDDATGAVADDELDMLQQVTPPKYDARGIVRPETCNGVDDDDSASADEGLCCVPSLDGLQSNGSPPGNLVSEMLPVGLSDTENLFVVRKGTDVELLSIPHFQPGRADMGVKAIWSGYGHLVNAALSGSLSAILAETSPFEPPPPADAGLPVDAAPLPDAAPPVDMGVAADLGPLPPDAGVTPELHILWRVGEVAMEGGPVPCSPVLHLEFVGEGARTLRLYCPAQAMELAEGALAGTPIPYPAGDVVRWIVRGFQGDPDAYLVARGPDADLSIWRDDAQGGLTPVDMVLPVQFNQLAPADRQEPIYAHTSTSLPVRIAGAQVQVLLANGTVGWVTMPASYTAESAYIDPTEPVAWSTGGADGLNDPSMRVFAHDLRPGGQPWGVALDLQDGQVAIPQSLPHRMTGVTYPRIEGVASRIFRVEREMYAMHGYSVVCRNPNQ